jgi:hypothetical protein
LQSVAVVPILFYLNPYKKTDFQLQTSMKKNLHLHSREELVALVATLSQKLKKKTGDLTLARHRLSKAKQQIKRLEGIVSYQRGRIIELHS